MLLGRGHRYGCVSGKDQGGPCPFTRVCIDLLLLLLLPLVAVLYIDILGSFTWLSHRSSGHDEGGSGSSGPLCVYQQALGELCRLKEAFPVSIGNVWAHCTALLLQEWALHR